MKVLNIKNIVIGQGMPKICVSLMGRNKEIIDAQLQQMKQVAFDILEWRIDYLDALEEVVEIAKNIQAQMNDRVLLYTFRTLQEGGKKAITKEAYIDLYEKLISNKVCDMIDVEMFMDEEVNGIICSLAHKANIYVVGSYHNFDKTLKKEELIQRFMYMQESHADVCKIACMPKYKEDVEIMMQATKAAHAVVHCPLIAISMGELGKPSRMLGEMFGSAITFGCIKKASAPGQIEVSELYKILEDVHIHQEQVISKYMD